MREVTEEDIDRDLASRVLAWLELSPAPLSFQRIASAYQLSSEEQETFLNPVLEFLEQSQKINSTIDKKGTRRFQATNPNSPVMVVRIIGRATSGHILVQPVKWHGATPPVIRIKRKNHVGLGLDNGDHLLIAIQSAEENYASARILQRLADFKEARLTGRFNGTHVTWQKGKLKASFAVTSSECGGIVKDGDVVEFSLRDDVPQQHPEAHVRRFIFEPNGRIDRLGDIALVNRGLARRYPSRIEDEASALANHGVKKRDHHFHINLPFLTVDPTHAKDHDDAIYTSSRKDGGHDIYIAIADVAHYVRPGSEIDKYARSNGVSNYPLDRVVHMLPRAFSEDLLSLKQHKLRRAIVLQMQIDKDGHLVFCTPYRGLIQVRENLSYEAVEGILGGHHVASPEISQLVSSMNAAYQALRPSLSDDRDLELLSGKTLPVIDEKTGRITGFQEKVPSQAHDMIEKFMILANKSIAELLDQKDVPYLRRAHKKPDMFAFREAEIAFEKLGLTLPENGLSTPGQLNNLLLQAAGDNSKSFQTRQIIGNLIPKARYTTQAMAHWGLHCESYTHFTSPIRRYADILTHRALITAFPHLGEGGLSQNDRRDMDKIADQLNFAEDRAKQIEREVLELYTAALMSGRSQETLPAKIISKQKHGVFVESPTIPYIIKMPARDFKDAAEGSTVFLRVTHADPMSGQLDFTRSHQTQSSPTPKIISKHSPVFSAHASHAKTRTHIATILSLSEARNNGGIPKTQIAVQIDNSKTTLTLSIDSLCGGSLTARALNGQQGIYSYEKRMLFAEGVKFRLYITHTRNNKGAINPQYRAEPLKESVNPPLAPPQTSITVHNLQDLRRLVA